VISNGPVLGTYIHGIFDSPEFTTRLIKLIYARKGLNKEVPKIEAASVHQEKELNRLADVLRQNLDLEMIYRVIGL
jgi:adenosylcobyric acid synthase